MRKDIILYSPEAADQGAPLNGGGISIPKIKIVTGGITSLRVQDVNTKYGPKSDQIDVDVIVKINSVPQKAFGFKLRKDKNEITHKAMFDLLKDAFTKNLKVTIEYIETKGKNNFVLIRIIVNK